MNSRQITLYHNPRCSKSRAALSLVEQHVTPNKELSLCVVRYLDTPPSRDDLEQLLEFLDCRPVDLMRTGDTLFSSLNLSREMDDSLLLDALVKNPPLLQRPIAIFDGRAAIGRPPENILELLSGQTP